MATIATLPSLRRKKQIYYFKKETKERGLATPILTGHWSSPHPLKKNKQKVAIAPIPLRKNSKNGGGQPSLFSSPS